MILRREWGQAVVLRQLAAFVLYTGLLSGLLYAGYSHWSYDDPFITYRYADNLAHGLGFVYNPGDRVLSTTTPLFVLLLSIAGRVWPDLPSLAILIGAISLAVGSLFIWDLSHTWKAPWVGWVGLLLFPAFPLLVATLSSETPLYICLCLGAFAFFARKRYVATAVFAGLAVLTRPDGILVALVLVSAYLLRSVRQGWQTAGSLPWGAAGLFLLITAPWFLIAWGYFGSPLPVTLAVKQHQATLLASQQFAAGLVTIAADYAGGWPYWLEACMAVVGLVFCGLKASKWSLLLAWTALYFAAYSLLRVSRYYWYYAPLVPGFVLCVGLGLTWLSGLQTTSLQRITLFHPLPGKSGVYLAGLFLVFLSCFQAGQLWQMRQVPDPRYAIYRAAGEWLAENTPASARVGMLEVGIIGYYSHRPVVDFAGLIQPQVASQLMAESNYEKAALWAIAHYRPDYILLRPGMFPEVRQTVIDPRCVLAKQLDGSAYGNVPDLQIYFCDGG